MTPQTSTNSTWCEAELICLHLRRLELLQLEPWTHWSGSIWPWVTIHPISIFASDNYLNRLFERRRMTSYKEIRKAWGCFPPGNRDTPLRQFVMRLWICRSNSQRQVPGIWHPYFSTARGCLFSSTYSSSLQDRNDFNYQFLTLGTLLLFISVYTSLT